MSIQENRERSLRRRLRNQGYALHKSRTKNYHADDLGGYMIVNANYNAVVAGSRFELDLDDVEDFVKEYA